MTQSYVKECVYCKQKIRMSDETGKWLPYNEDGSIHDCKSKDKEQGQGQEKKDDKKQVTLEMVQRKLESIGIIINVERLMKE